MDKPKLSLVLPAHNEQENLPLVLRGLQNVLRKEQIPYELIVVNDNSSDNTASILRDFTLEDPSIIQIDRQPPAGFGRAIREGIKHVTGDVVIVYMADCSDDPEDALLYYKMIAFENYDCVYGSRFIKNSYVVNYPFYKLVVNRISNKLVQLLFLTRFNDLTNAFKAYKTSVLIDCGPFVASHFNITIELSLAPLIRNYSIAQVPINWYGRTAGVSHLKLRTMSRRYLSTLLKMFFDRILIKDDILEETDAFKAGWE